jgi:hypothetical protein
MTCPYSIFMLFPTLSKDDYEAVNSVTNMSLKTKNMSLSKWHTCQTYHIIHVTPTGLLGFSSSITWTDGI